MAESYPMRQACPACGGWEGRIEPKAGQQCVYCGACGRWVYNAPKDETDAARAARRRHLDRMRFYKLSAAFVSGWVPPEQREPWRCGICGGSVYWERLPPWPAERVCQRCHGKPGEEKRA